MEHIKYEIKTRPLIPLPSNLPSRLQTKFLSRALMVIV